MNLVNATRWYELQWTSDNSTPAPKIVLPPMLKAGVGTFRIPQECRSIQGTGTTTQDIMLRYFDVLTTRPRTANWAPQSYSLTANGTRTDDLDLSAEEDAMWVQFALSGAYSSGLGGALSRIMAMNRVVSQIVVSGTVKWQPWLNASSTANVAVGRPFPVLGLTHLMFGIVASGIGPSQTITFQPIWRKFDTLLTEPGAWATLGGSSTSKTSNSTWNSGTISLTSASEAFGQVGLQITSAAQADLQVIVAAISP